MPSKNIFNFTDIQANAKNSTLHLNPCRTSCCERTLPTDVIDGEVTHTLSSRQSANVAVFVHLLLKKVLQDRLPDPSCR